MNGDSPRPFYLPQLDGLRFIAFFLVFLHHAPSAQHLFAPGSLGAYAGEFFRRTGWMGVDLFLVLSAYLITTLLLLERQRTGTIALRDFYLRRVLRIWPLYYLMCFLGFFLLPLLGRLAPTLGSAEHRDLLGAYLAPYLTLFGNFAVGTQGYPPVHTLSHLWTIALEEQFYLVWPLLLGFVVAKSWRPRWRVIAALLVVEALVRLSVAPIVSPPWIWTFTMTRLDPLILGAALAFRHFQPRPEASSARSWSVLALAALVLLAVPLGGDITTQPRHISWQLSASALGFALVLESLLARRRGVAVWLLSRAWMTHLGRVSYGLYAFHMLALQVGVPFAGGLRRLVPEADVLVVWLTEVLVSFALVVAAAEISFATFERPFLRLKARFAHVASGSGGLAAPSGGRAPDPNLQAPRTRARNSS